MNVCGRKGCKNVVNGVKEMAPKGAELMGSTLPEGNEVIDIHIEGADGKGSGLVRMQWGTGRWIVVVVDEGGGVGKILEPMGGCRGATTACVGEVGGGFGRDAEERGGLDPPHWKDEGDGDELLFVGGPRKDDRQAGSVVGGQADAIKTVGDVNL